ncbi:hypothetical protein SteCoe_27375 [Stentor coeruleus]|uniref:Uncharacterized protein n=1 Tax=Stentor coeruleus TaxID=5963 RepID=A0A1R2BAR2_9CILI|nr:hypothetical protein SteCoe_27375 [Stentor coeruleus]
MIRSIKTLFHSNHSCENNEDFYKELKQRIQLIEKIQNKIKKQTATLKISLEKWSERAICNLEKFKKFYCGLKKQDISEKSKEILINSRLSPTSNMCINTRKLEEYFYQNFIIEEHISKYYPNNLETKSPQELKVELENRYGLTITGHTGYITSLAILPDNDHFITCSHDKTIRLWSLKNESQEHIFHGHTEKIWNVSLNFTGRLFVSSSADRTVKIWDLEEKCLMFTKIGHTNEVNAAVFTKDNRIISGSDENYVRIWDLYSDNEIGKIDNGSGVLALAVTQDDQRIVLGSKDSIIKIWNLQTLTKDFELSGHNGWVRSIVLSKDNSMIVSGGFDYLVNLYNFQERALKHSVSLSSNVCSVAFSADQQNIIAGVGSGKVQIISVSQFTIDYSFCEHKNRVKTVEMSSDGSFMISGSDDCNFIIWDVETKKRMNVCLYQLEPLKLLGATPDFKYVFIGSGNGIVKFWDLETKKCLEKYEGFEDALEVKFSTNIKYMVFADCNFRFKVCFVTKKMRMLLSFYAKRIKTEN